MVTHLRQDRTLVRRTSNSILISIIPATLCIYEPLRPIGTVALALVALLSGWWLGRRCSHGYAILGVTGMIGSISPPYFMGVSPITALLIGYSAGYVICLIAVNGRLVVRGISMCLITFVSWAMASVFWSGNTATALSSMLSIGSAIALIILGMSQAADRDGFNAYIATTICAGVTTSVVGLLFTRANSVVYGYEGTVRLSGVFNDPNFYCAYLASVLALALSCHLPLVRVGFSSIIGLGLIGSLSRGGIATGLVVAIMGILVNAKKSRKRGIVSLFGFAALAAVVLASVPLAINRSVMLQNAVQRFRHFDDFGQRGAIWRAGFEMLEPTPLWGIGIGQFIATVGAFAHNVTIEIVVELGIVGYVIFGIAVLNGLGAAARYKRLTEDASPLLQLVATILGGMTISAHHVEFFWMSLLTVVWAMDTVAAPRHYDLEDRIRQVSHAVSMLRT